YLASQGGACAALIRTWHRDPRGVASPVLRTIAGHAAGCVCVSREHENVLRSAGIRRTRFLHSAVDTDFFRPRAVRGEGASLIGQAGRWKREHGRDRGQRFTLEVFARLPAHLSWRGALAGRGEMESELARRACDEPEPSR